MEREGHEGQQEALGSLDSGVGPWNRWRRDSQRAGCLNLVLPRGAVLVNIKV